MNSNNINEQMLYEEILSKFLEISANDNLNERKRDIFFWKATELKKLMKLLENKGNSSIVTHAITFILSLEREEDMAGINVSHLNGTARSQVRKILKCEIIEKLVN